MTKKEIFYCIKFCFAEKIKSLGTIINVNAGY